MTHLPVADTPCRTAGSLARRRERGLPGFRLASKGVAWASLNQVVCALRFFYGVTLGRPEMPERIAYAREPRKLPVVLCVEEVVRFLEAVPGLKSRVALTTAYAAGLRAA
jgi:integrase/recombinase XerD